MKIAVWHNLPSGGGKRALFDQVCGLVARGHSVEVWSPPTANQTYLPLNKLVPEHIVPLRQPSTKRLSYYVSDVTDRLAAMREHCQACADQINQQDFDLVLVHPCQEFRVAPIGQMLNAPAVLYLQEPARMLYEASPNLVWWAVDRGNDSRLAWLKRRIKDLLLVRQLRIQALAEYQHAKAYQRILVNSYFSRESVLRAYGLNAHVCYLGISTAIFAPQDIPSENLVVGIGALMAEKNIHFVIDALGYVNEPRPRLVWIGNVAGTAYGNWLNQLATERGVDYTPLQMIPDAEVVGYLNRAFAFVYAPRLEPFGLAPLEANACGTPAIGVAEGGVRETIINEQTGLLVDGTQQEFAKAVMRLRDDPEFARQLGQHAQHRVRIFWSVEAATDRLEQQLYAVLDEAQKS